MQPVAGDGAKELVSKAEFARRVKRTPGRVSQWLKEGRLHGAALETDAEGNEKINLGEAVRQLGLSLDVSQQAAQSAPILPGLQPPRAAASEFPVPADERDDVALRLARAKAESAELAVQEARRRAMAENGRWVRVDEVLPAWQRNLGDLLNRIESDFPEMAKAIAAECGGEPRSLAIALRREFRTLREKLARDARLRAQSMPETVEDTSAPVEAVALADAAIETADPESADA